jgi:hypothetical protein
MPFLSNALSMRSLHSAQLPCTSNEITVFLMGLGPILFVFGKVKAAVNMPIMANIEFKMCFVFMIVCIEFDN